jgi:hypothetical protein
LACTSCLTAVASDPEAEGRPAESRTRSEDTVKRDRRVELLAAILLSAATVVTAWSAYQATRWSGEQAASYTKASAKRTESVRASTLVNRQILIDVSTFLDWVDATAEDGDEVRAADIHERMREEFLPAFDTWLVSTPGEELPPGTPFTLPEYVSEAQQEADRLEAEASKAFEDGAEANQISDNFVLAAVLLASVLFFAGLAGTFDSLRAQVFLLILGAVMFLAGSAIVLTLPQNVGFSLRPWPSGSVAPAPDARGDEPCREPEDQDRQEVAEPDHDRGNHADGTRDRPFQGVRDARSHYLGLRFHALLAEVDVDRRERRAVIEQPQLALDLLDAELRLVERVLDADRLLDRGCLLHEVEQHLAP